MARLQSALNVSDDGCVSIDPTPPFTPEAKRARRMAKHLHTLHNAIAAGKDFDLNGARRSALLNEWRGPATFDHIRIAVERHLTDKAARRFFMDRIAVFWKGSETLFADKNPRELAALALIEDAIAAASGANKLRIARQAREGSSPASPEDRTAANTLRAERAKRSRIARKAENEAVIVDAMNASPELETLSGGLAVDPSSPEFFSADRVEMFSRVMLALFVVFVFVAKFAHEIEGAFVAAIRRGSTHTMDFIFNEELQRRIEGRLRRAETNRSRMSLARRQNKRDHGAGGVVNDTA
jgi:hypothetical protein